MRKIDKPARPIPEALEKCFKEKEAGLLRQEDRHNFDNQCYGSIAIKAELNKYYHQKCAFCETRLTEHSPNSPNSFTIEHFRPKGNGLYYWLAYEWTNLLPACRDCNQHKNDSFQLPNRQEKAKVPIIIGADGQKSLNLDRCNAHSQDLLKENADLIHPELEDPMDFLTFDVKKIGFFVENPTNRRATHTIKTYDLNRIALAIEKRKKCYDDLYEQIAREMIILLENCCAEDKGLLHYDEQLFNVAFQQFFERLYNNACDEKAEYTSFWQFLLFNFDQLFEAKMDTPETQKILTDAMLFFLAKKQIL